MGAGCSSAEQIISLGINTKCLIKNPPKSELLTLEQKERKVRATIRELLEKLVTYLCLCVSN
jgi:hypothetical protein